MRLENVKIINASGVIDNANVEITNGLISKITPRPGQGKQLLLPGLIDVHIHGFGGDDVMDSAAAMRRIAKGLTRFGVTGFMPTVMTNSIAVLKKSLAGASIKTSAIGARNLGIHLEGPFISLAKKGAHDPQFILLPNVNLFREFQDAANGQIRKMTIAPEYFEPAHYASLRELNILPSIGHTNATIEETNVAIAEGASSATHLWNAMSGVANRSQGAVAAILNSDEVYSELLADLMHIDAETIKLTLRAKGLSRVIAATDALKISGMPDGVSVSGGLAVEKHGIKVTLQGTNTIAGSGGTMHDLLLTLIKLGFSLPEVVSLTSYNASKWLNINQGEVREGAPADLVLLNAKYQVLTTIVNGKVIYTTESSQKRLRPSLQAAA